MDLHMVKGVQLNTQNFLQFFSHKYSMLKVCPARVISLLFFGQITGSKFIMHPNKLSSHLGTSDQLKSNGIKYQRTLPQIQKRTKPKSSSKAAPSFLWLRCCCRLAKKKRATWPMRRQRAQEA
jgi:hypothetical protein